MKVIIAGGREGFILSDVVKAYLQSGFIASEIVSGGAPGVDSLGETFANINNIPIKRFPANWNTLGKAAGPIRNRQMANYAEALIALWDGQSKGTKNMIEEANKKGLLVYVFRK